MTPRWFLAYTIATFLLVGFLAIPKGADAATFTDTFTNTNGTNLTTHNSDYSIQVPDAMVTIQSNAITPTSSTVWVSNHDFADGCMSMDWTGNSSNTNIAVRVDNGSPQRFYNFLQHNNNGDWLLRGYYGGSYHTIASGNTSFSGTHTYKLCAIGNTISVYKDGSLFASGTDSGNPNSGYQTFYSEGNLLDNLKVWAIQ